MSPIAIRSWLAGSVLLALLAAPFLVRGDQSIWQARQQNAAAIEQMSLAQRQRLDRNLEEYQRMDAQQRAAMQSLHATIENDRRQGTGELAAVMTKYDAWLKTLEPYQRDQLSQEKDPAARLALMREIVRRQREQTARRNTPPWPPGGDRPGHDWPPALDEKSLANVMQAIEKAAGPRLSAAQVKELESLRGLKRYVQLLQYLHDFGTGVTPRPFLESPNTIPPEFGEVARNINQYVSDPRLQQRIQSNMGPWNEGQRLGGVLLQSLVTELYKQRRSLARQPDPTKLEEFLATLPADEQDELLTREASDFQTDLRNQYLDAEGMDNLPSGHQLRELFFGHRPGDDGSDRHGGNFDDRGPPPDGSRGPGSHFGPREGRGFRGRPDGPGGPGSRSDGRRDGSPDRGAAPPSPPSGTDGNSASREKPESSQTPKAPVP